MVLVSAWITEVIGIHALFGAFLLGAIMPKGNAFVRTLTEKLEDFTVVFLLPIFFAFTGLKTRIGVLDSGEMWFYCGLVILAACAVNSADPHWPQEPAALHWREAGAIGILMNTRGLMELVILNVGRELGVITEAVFAMMVIMALTTTALTTPILHLGLPAPVNGAGTGCRHRRRVQGSYSRFIAKQWCFAGASCECVDRNRPRPADPRAGPRAPGRSGRDPIRSGCRSPAGKRPGAFTTAQRSRQRKNSCLCRFICQPRCTQRHRAHRPVAKRGFDPHGFPQSRLYLQHSGGTVHRVLTGSDSDVAIYVFRGESLPKSILVPFLGTKHDRLALELAGRLARNTTVAVTVLHVTSPKTPDDAPPTKAQTETDRVFNDPSHPLPVTMRTLAGDSPVDVLIEQAKEFDLVVLGVAEEWGLESQLLGFRAERVAREVACSLLIVRKHGSFAEARGVVRPIEEHQLVGST